MRSFGAAADYYAAFRAGFPDSFFDRITVRGLGVAGQVLVDLGTGTGTLARGFAARGASAIGVDPDARLLEQARRLSAEARLAVDYREGTAEAIPVPDASADIVTAGQCWHWFDADRAAAECARVLRPGGWMVIGHFDWLPAPGSVVEATERLIQRHNPAWKWGGGNGFHPHEVADLERAGFTDIETFSYGVDVPYAPEGWRGRIRASAGVGASLTPEKVDAFDAELAALLEEKFPDGVVVTPHRVFAIVARRP